MIYGMKNFALQAGVKLRLQFPNEPQRGHFQVTVIGYVEGCSIMITAPQKNGSLLLLREGQQFVVRVLSGTQIAGFNSEVTKVYNNPFSYVHLKPPVKVELQNIRNAHRVDLEIIATIHKVKRDEESGEIIKPKNNETIAAKVNNMSTTGCQVQMIKPLSEDTNELAITTKIVVVEQKRMLTFEAVVRSHRVVEIKGSNWHVYGMEFNEMDDDRRLLLNCFIYEKLVKSFYNE